MNARAAPGVLVTPSLELTRRIGAGGMGTVWLARHKSLQKDVVIKLMAESMVASPSLRRRFAQEASAGANVKSPHVVQVFDTGISEELGPYIVMELLEGEDLGARLSRDGTMTPPEVARLVTQVAHALDRAHAIGIVHRDIKPPNLFLCEEPGAPFVAKVLDFGVARLRSDAAPLTRTGASLGTPTYMSPEQAAGRGDVDGKSDLYALGLVAFRALTGAPAFARESFDALGLGVYNLPAPKLTDHAPALPAAVDAWFARACARGRDDRFADGATMARELSRALGVATEGASSETPEHAAPAPPPASDDPPMSGGATLARDDAPRSEPEAEHDEGSRREVPAEPSAAPSAAPSPETPITDAGLTQRTSPGEAREAAPAPKRRLPAVVALVALAVIVAGAWALRARSGEDTGSVRTPPSSASVPPPAPTAIPIGVLLDLSGERRRSGEALLAATRAAEKLVNESGGVLARPIRLVVKDDQGDTGTFLKAATQELLQTEGLKVILGPMTSAQVDVVAPLAQAAGVLEITGSATSPELSTLQRPGERMLFRTVPSQTLQAKALARVMRGAATTPIDRPVEPPSRCAAVAIVAPDDVDGRPFVQVLGRALEQQGGRLVQTRFVPAAPQVTYAADIGAVARSGADCLVLALGPKAAARYLRQALTGSPADARTRRPTTYAVNTLATDDFLAYAQDDPRDPSLGSVANGVRGVRPATKLTWRPEYLEFTRLLPEVDAGAEAGAEPFAASQFDAAMYAAMTLETAGPSPDASALRRAFFAIAHGGNVYGPHELPQLLAAIRRGQKVDYIGASGDVEVDENGDVEAELVTWVVEGGKIVETGRVPPETDAGR
ncbi:MAG: bifunctional serine/threonine-protein kinase/ABC transporter substrate-binding protein [Polyangiaceae bacterium]